MSFKIKQMKYCMLIVMLWRIIFAFLEINTQTDSYGYMHSSPHQSIHSSLYSGIFFFLSALAANQFFSSNIIRISRENVKFLQN